MAHPVPVLSGGIRLVREELESTLQRTRALLEQWAEGDAGEAVLAQAAAELRQVRGTASVLQCAGAALVAEEARETVRRLADGAVARSDSATSAVLGAIVQLGDYLDAMASGHADCPQVLLPAINEMRVARGEPVLGEDELFARQLLELGVVPDGADETVDDRRARAAARKGKVPYQAALLALVKSDERAALPRLARVADFVAGHCPDGRCRLLWRATAALATATAAGGVDATEAKRLAGRAARVLGVLAEQGLPAAEAADPDLPGRMLFHLARSAVPEATALASETGALALLADEAAREALAARIGAPNSALLMRLSQEIHADLAQAKDAIDLINRAGDSAPASLDAVRERLASVAETLGMLGLGTLRQVLRRTHDRLGDAAQPLDGAGWDELATELLRVEHGIDAALALPLLPPDERARATVEEYEQDVPHSADLREGRGAALREALANLARLESAVDGAVRGGDAGGLSQVASLLGEVRAAMRLLQLEEAQELLGVLYELASSPHFAGILSDQAMAARFALAVAACEYYLIAVRDGSADAAARLAAFAEAVAAMSGDLEAARQRARADEAAGEPAAQAPAAGGQGAADAAGVGAAAEADEAPAQAAAVAADAVDPELREVFVEEVQEILAQLRARMPAFDQPEPAPEALAEVRRAFHTLKGSGRMVGATEIGEFAWAIEQLLNRCIDGSRPIDAEVREITRAAVDLLPEAASAFRDGRAVPGAAAELAERARRAAAGGGDALPEIFSSDARTQLARMRAVLDGEQDDPAQVLRALHSLRGSAAVVGEQRVATLAAEAERQLRERGIERALRDPELRRLLADSVAAIERWLAGTPYVPVDDPSQAAELLARWQGQGGSAAPAQADEGETLAAAAAVEALDVLEAAEQAARQWLAEGSAAARATLCDRLQGLAALAASAGGTALARGAEALANAVRGVERPDAAVAEALPQRIELLFQALDAWRDGEAPGDPDAVAGKMALPAAPAAGTEDDELLEIFCGELEELLQELEAALAAWRERPADGAARAAIGRVLHTLKGSARLAGQEGIGTLAHRAEQLLEVAAAAGGAAAAPAADALAALVGALGEALPVLRAGRSPELTDAEARIAQAVERIGAAEGTADEDEVPEYEVDAEDLLVPLEQVERDALALTGEAPVPPDEDTGNGAATVDTEPPEAPEAEAVELVGPAPVGEEVAEPHATDDAEPAVDAELVEVFLGEAGELIEQMDAALARWTAAPDDASAMHDLARALHTFKGGARMAGLRAMGDRAHEMEALIERIEAGRERADAVALATLAADLDALHALHDALSAGEIAPEHEPQPEAAAAQAADTRAMVEMARDDAAVQPARRETARVAVEALDTLLGQAGEISILRARLEQNASVVQAQLDEMRRTILRVREQLRQMELETEAQIQARGLAPGGALGEQVDRYAGEFDPLELDRYSRMQELSRALSESIGDLSSLHETMDSVVDESETLLHQQGVMVNEVQQGLMRTLMVPFARQVQRLQRVERQAAAETGKRVELDVRGIEAQMDRKVLERMTAPLEHLLRNAVVHGIETPEQRRAAGKPETGRIALSLAREGTQLVIELADDGRGLDVAAIRERAAQRGLIPADAELDERALVQFIFEPGFSTATRITQLAGRGIGMDVVASEVKQLGGTLELGHEAGRGTRFRIRLPLTLALSQVLLVQVGGERYALPLSGIEGMARIPADALPALLEGQGEGFEYAGRRHEVHYMADFVGLPRPAQPDARSVPAVLVELREGLDGKLRHLALVVDAVIGNREIVSKPVGTHLGTIHGLAGATILSDGAVVLILDVQALIRDRARRELLSREQPEAQRSDARPLVLVVDDSITMRRVAERLLTRAGYRVATARDGLEAIAMLQTERPDAILLDIEMPRADGFEVAAFVRNTPHIRGVPIVMITSRSGEKHRERARAAGVDRYLIKPYQEERLLAELRALTAAEGTA